MPNARQVVLTYQLTVDPVALRLQEHAAGCGIPSECIEFEVDRSRYSSTKDQAVRSAKVNPLEVAQAADYE